MSFSLEPQSGWSCPIRVDKLFLRRSLCVIGQEEPVALVVTSHQHKGQTFVAIHRDERPQLLLENKTDTVLFCAQSLGGGEVASEAQHFRWNCKLPKARALFYTMSGLQEKFPELPQNNFSEKIALAVESESKLILTSLN